MIVDRSETHSDGPVIRSTILKLCKLAFVTFCLFSASAAFGATPHDPKIVKYVDKALDIMERRSIMRNLIEWEEFREITFERASELNDMSDAHATIRDAVMRLGDNYGRLILPDQAAALKELDESSGGPPAWIPVSGRLVDQHIGLITVPTFVGLNKKRMKRYVDEMHDVMKSIDSDEVCAWIVDIRENTGGNVHPMLSGIGPILGSGRAGGGVGADGTTYFYSVKKNGRSGEAGPSRRAYRLKNRNPPVAVLIGRKTASSGEAIALAFIGREETLTFGEPTAGHTIGWGAFTLKDGAILNLAGTVMIDRIGRRYGGSIQPQVAASNDEIIGVAVGWLSSMGLCR
jgi:carboxyl-terminal processing protease